MNRFEEILYLKKERKKLSSEMYRQIAYPDRVIILSQRIEELETKIEGLEQEEYERQTILREKERGKRNEQA